ncbi:Bug family tripartite tricarboxylate transporter substrate binding protein [Ramlibacter alkalitolerans]|uniref:Tripartite tricarboxylate transporter substrate binding protein n=1 Tax=Ramlibacter alkalitolerans TaxID=2039631 RepID=A0ABS1JVF5_9BURK|nr:tripartite tricarboxylate transporter substrate binding protein [Ramlibacter alkalitolerans]MBL0428299.1 tripartite tricarboxylate transporter substrate binding protein [Ramlibacter alkalitolerans]
MSRFLAGCALAFAFCGSVAAQTTPWPERPVKLVVGFTPGGAADYVGRAVGDALSRALGQPIVIDNKPGAGSSIAADFVAKAPPDGYTLLIASPSAISVNPAIDPKWAASVQNLVPVAKLTASPLVVAANPQLGVKSIPELIEYARKNPGKVNFAHAGMGSAPHLGGVLFNQLTGVNLTPIPFKGGAPSVQSVIAGDTQVTFATPPSVLPQIKGGRLVGLGVTTTERFALIPDLPGMKEAGLPAYKIDFWYGFFVPAGTPPEIVKKLFDATQVALQKPEVKAALAREGTDVSASSSVADFAAFIKEENRFWAKLAKDSGAKAD